VIGRFIHLVRADAQGRPIVGYTIDPTAKEAQQSAFHPFADSVVSYHLKQGDNGISLAVDNTFLHNPAFCWTAQALVDNLEP
jgi:hypothetical protein